MCVCSNLLPPLFGHLAKHLIYTRRSVPYLLATLTSACKNKQGVILLTRARVLRETWFRTARTDSLIVPSHSARSAAVGEIVCSYIGAQGRA